MTAGMTRRDFLKLTSVGTLAVAFGWGLEACGDGEKVAEFFTPEQRATLGAAAARILPGAGEAGAVPYIERLLTAFEYDPPLIFAGGPFSGRQPFADNEQGAPSDDFPENEFARFLPLPRAKEIGWRVRLYGSANVPGGDFNDAVLEPVTGYRDLYQQGLQELDAKARELAGKSFVELTPEQQDQALAGVDQAFAGQLAEHAVESMYAAPEYGGNADLLGWQSIGFEGDSQPLGYSLFNESSSEYEELAEHPVSTENPDEDFGGLQGEVLEFIEGIALGQGGRRFF